MESLKKLRKKYSVAELIKKFDDRYGFQALVRKLTGHWFNPFATFYVNFLSFPLKQAIKLPMFVYGSPGLYHVVGNMQIVGKVKSGMIKFNLNQVLNPPHQLTNSELSNLGTIIFHGNTRIGCGTRILVQKNATLELGNFTLLGDNVNIGCHRHISVGDYSQIAHRCQIQESNHHFIIDLNTRLIKPCIRPISIGRNCWICNSTTINAGAIIPNYCIVASNSLINGKKEIANATPGSIIGGVPAKVLSEGGRYRIFSQKWEGILAQWFISHPDETYILPDDVSIETLINP